MTREGSRTAWLSLQPGTSERGQEYIWRCAARQPGASVSISAILERPRVSVVISSAKQGVDVPEVVLPENVSATFDDVRSVVFLFSPDYARVVLLCRAAWKSFAPLRWTGIGGRMEGDEVNAPTSGALRELREETGLTLADLREWRFVADILDPGAEVRLVYFTAVYPAERLPPCNEGTLHWIPLADYPRCDLIENTRVTLDAILAYDLLHTAEALPWRGVIERDAAGHEPRLVFVPPR